MGNLGTGADLTRSASAAVAAAVVATVVASIGCASSDDPATGDTGGPGPGSSSGETTDAETGTTAPTAPTAPADTGATPNDSDASTAAAGETSTGMPSVDDTSGDATTVMPPDDSACPPGEDGCPCDDGTCDFGLTCLGNDTCGIPGACPADPNESNESEATATNLGGIEDCNADGSMLSGVLDGEGDVDWFRYSGDDVAFCTVDPERTLAVDGPVRFCKFAECAAGVDETEVSCPVGVTQSVSPDGRPGCCSDDGFAFEDLNCPGLDDDATIYLRLDEAVSDCAAYTLSYHY